MLDRQRHGLKLGAVVEAEVVGEESEGLDAAGHRLEVHTPLQMVDRAYE